MKLSELHSDLLNSVYPKGYVVPEGEEGYFHIMFVDIVKGKGKRSTEKAVFQKYFPAEWTKMRAVIENPVYTILATGHDEYAIVHDPAEYEEAQKATAKKEAAKLAAEVKEEAKAILIKAELDAAEKEEVKPRAKPGPKPSQKP